MSNGLFSNFEKRDKMSGKILVPLKNDMYIDQYIELGADEFYIGFNDKGWYNQFGKYCDINRMSGYKKIANPLSFEEMLKVIELVKTRKKKIYVTFNAGIYHDYVYEQLEIYLYQLAQINVDGIIVSDENIIKLAHKYGLNVILSTMAGVYNEDILKYYVNLGVKRVIIPRDVTIQELKSMKLSFPQIEFEVFLMRNGCVFSDSNCLGLHMIECGALCTWLKNSEKKHISLYKNFNDIHNYELNHFLYNNTFHINACGLCSIYDLENIGVCAYKIVGRGDDIEGIKRDIKNVKDNLNIAKKSQSKKNYLKNMIFPENRYEICKLGLNCYYPESRFKK